MLILNETDITRKIRRISFEIAENHLSTPVLWLAGINNRGYHMATLLKEELDSIFSNTVQLSNIKVNTHNPTDPPPVFEGKKNYNSEPVIVVDDVANTGRTLLYAINSFTPFLPERIEAAVLVDRKHKSYPIKVNYIGLQLATTLREHIEVQFEDEARAVLL